MCGIAGVRRYSDEPINKEELFTLLCSLEHRGNHSTGISLLNGNELFTHKDHVPAWAFVATTETRDFIEEHLTEETSIALLHTRFATVGNPNNNENNHPITDGTTSIVHNGSISNHMGLFTSEEVRRNCETDSDIIRAILDKYGFTEAGLDALSKMSGSAAIAAVSTESPDLLVLGRSGSPLAYGLDDKKLWWASEMGAIQKAVKPWVQKHGLMARQSRPGVGYFTMPDNTVYLLGPTSIQMRREMKVCVHYNAPTYAGMRDNYGSKMRNYRDEHRREMNTRGVSPVATPQLQLPAPTTPIVAAVAGAYVQGEMKVAPCPKCAKKYQIKRTDSFKGYYCANRGADGKKCGTHLTELDDLFKA